MERALVANNYGYRFSTGVLSMDALPALEYAKRFFPSTPVLQSYQQRGLGHSLS